MDKKDTRDPIKNEADNGLVNDRGSIAMARTSRPHSATAQFFINHKYNSFLDYPGQDGWGYAVFGRVTKGLDVVDKIADVKTGRKNGMRDVPRSPRILATWPGPNATGYPKLWPSAGMAGYHLFQHWQALEGCTKSPCHDVLTMVILT